MFKSGPYRRSVWIDVFGVLLAGAVLLGGAGYLLYHVGSATSGLTPASQATAARSGRAAPARPRPGPGAGGVFSSESRPLLSDRSPPTGTAAPFSKDWREQASPSLAGPSSEGGVTFGGAASAEGAASSGPTIASSPSLGGTESRSSGSTWSGNAGRNGGQSWRREARQLAGRARALGGQLRQLEQDASRGDGKKATSNEKAPGEASTASATTNDRDVPTPPSVPIDDHLHWLIVAGLLWGIWRLS